MGKINYGRVILGGVVGGIIAFVLDSLVNVIWLGQQWLDTMKSLNRPNGNPGPFFLCLFLAECVGAILTIWVYAAVRPRFGAGLRTSVYAGLVAWVFGILLPHVVQVAQGLYPLRLMICDTGADLLIAVFAAIIGCALYKEAESNIADPATVEARHTTV
ncbi:DUF1761 family protein [Occallatibacter riparius]|uniref:Uncharacterized protein n=1 Tax=Occallatibacter riparius TaxID=1002689 RepID=A0A9J7BU45_9BACT|nr:DUF1761 family protein [Occallatibacter riparius]UWZ86404.1 hypothetical protein MOP44_10770 [Occallatibacter riparius]